MTMQARTAEVLFGTSTQYFVLDQEDGRPSAVGTVEVRSVDQDDTTTAESATTGSASVESAPNTTIASAAVGPAQSDPRAMVVASGSSFTVGRRYLITEDNGGHWEVFECAFANGTSIRARHPLKNDYSIGATVQSTRCTIQVSTTWASDQSNLSPLWTPNPGYRIKWPVTINGQSTEYIRYADLVRQQSHHGVSPLDVEDSGFRGWLDNLGPDDCVDQGRSLIERGWSAVKFDMYQDRLAEQAARNAEAVAEMVICRTVLLQMDDNLARGAAVNDAWIKRASDRYMQRYNSFVRAGTLPVDLAGGGGTTGEAPKLALTVR